MSKIVKATFEYGIVIRVKSLKEKGIENSQLLMIFENEMPIDSNAELLSYGPHFGPEAMENFGSRLAELGLEYLDDFFYFQGDFPEWA